MNAVARGTINMVTSRDGTKIAYDRQGKGPSVILVAGALCSRLGWSGPALSRLRPLVLSRMCRPPENGAPRVPAADSSRRENPQAPPGGRFRGSTLPQRYMNRR